MKNILFIIQFDSFIKTLLPTMKNLVEDKYMVDVALLKKRFKKQWITKEILSLFNSIEYKLNSFSMNYQGSVIKMIKKNKYDLIIVGTSNTRLILNIKKKLDKKAIATKIASGYVGALLNNDFESFQKGLIRRSETDLIWLPGSNSKGMIEKLNIVDDRKTKLIDTGLPRFDELYKLQKNFKKNNRHNIIFFEQPTFPESKKERELLVEQLINIANLNPKSNIIIKPRFKKKVGHAHRPKYLLQDILDKKQKPTNISISNKDIYDLFQKCKMALTISSTAGLEALLVNIPTYFITDFCGTTNKYGSNDFSLINATTTFDDVFKNKLPEIKYNEVSNILRFDGNNTKRLSDAFKKIMTDE